MEEEEKKEVDVREQYIHLHAWAILHTHVNPEEVDLNVLLKAHEMWVEEQLADREQRMEQYRMQALCSVVIARAMGADWHAEQLFPGLFSDEEREERKPLSAEEKKAMEEMLNSFMQTAQHEKIDDI